MKPVFPIRPIEPSAQPNKEVNVKTDRMTQDSSLPDKLFLLVQLQVIKFQTNKRILQKGSQSQNLYIFIYFYIYTVKFL